MKIFKKSDVQLKLNGIKEKYIDIKHDDDNYFIGGGISDTMFASNRHVAAKNDPGKLTLGTACQILKNATGLDVKLIKHILTENFDLEWHHSGSFSKGMGKTYFINTTQFCEACDNILNWINNFNEEKNKQKSLVGWNRAYIKSRGVFFKRVLRADLPENHFINLEEMCSNSGDWFPSNLKYNLPIYFSGVSFKSPRFLLKFLEKNGIASEAEKLRYHMRWQLRAKQLAAKSEKLFTSVVSVADLENKGKCWVSVKGGKITGYIPMNSKPRELSFEEFRLVSREKLAKNRHTVISLDIQGRWIYKNSCQVLSKKEFIKIVRSQRAKNNQV